MIGPLYANGGPTATHALLQGSPLIDILPGCAGLTDDQRGEPRPQGSNCDPGAYEFDPFSPPPPPAPPPPAPGPGSSSSTRCDLFDEQELSLVLHSIPLGTTNLTLYTEMLSGVPGLELEIPGDQAPWIYTALLGDTESGECSVQEYASGRLYCDFVLPVTTLGSARNFSLYLNECEDPIFFQPRVSILEPQADEPSLMTCEKELDEASCVAAGGIYHPPVATAAWCECP